MPVEEGKAVIQWGAGIAASCMLIYMSYLSMRESFEIDTIVIIGMLALIIILLYGAAELTEIIRIWRGE